MGYGLGGSAGYDSPLMSKPSVPVNLRLVLSVLAAAGCSAPPSSIPFSGVEVRALMGSRSRCVDLRVRGETKVEGGKEDLRLDGGRVLLGIGNKSLGAWADVEAVGRLDDCATESGERKSGRLTFPNDLLVLELGPPQSGDASVDGGADDAGPSDAGFVDAGALDAGPSDAGFVDAGALDAGGSDAGEADAGAPDSGSSDAGGADAGTADAGGSDAGGSDAGRSDAGAFDGGADAGRVDAGSPDAGAPDAGRVDAGKDEDGDNYVWGVDCDDTNPAINPGAVELCADKEDNDCDSRLDCADLDCLGLSCGVDAGAFCRQPTGQDGGVCREETCNDLVDNDGDNSADCADVDCAALSCVDTLPCTSGSGSCSGGFCMEPTACAPPPPGTCMQQCRDSTFMCSGRPVPSGTSCDDGDLCTLSDSCADGGVCVGTPRSCPSPGVCRIGVCNPLDGGCASQFVDAGTACTTDNNVCTDDVCDVAGACLHSVVRFRACGTNGTCGADGGCNANGFPFDVSNVSDEVVSSWSAAAWPNNCTLRLDTSGTMAATVVTGTTCAGLSVGNTIPSQVATQANGAQVMVVARTGTQTIPSTLRVEFVGTRPVVLLVRGSLTVDGTVSVSASGITDGAGDGPCTTGVGQSTVTSTGAAGGGFGSAGAAGHNLTANPATTPGTVEGSASLEPLRGGCRGGQSVVNTSDTAVGGGAGGALQISVSGTLQVNGRLLAAGGGGEGGTFNSGGAGGGSGGAIFVESNTLTVAASGVIAANGGGGGQADTNGGLGQNGQDGQASSTPARGGQSTSFCTEYGGNGAAGTAAAGRPRPPQGCSPWVGTGGGGGGGAGRLRLRGLSTCNVAPGGTVSPPSPCGT